MWAVAGLVPAVAILVDVGDSDVRGNAAIAVFSALCGLGTARWFGAKERDVAVPMPYVASVAAFVGGLFVPLGVFVVFVFFWVATGHSH